MKNKRNGWIMLFFVGVTLVMLFFVVFFTFPTKVEAKAKAKVVSIEGISYNVNISLEDNLKSLIGKKVYVSLDSGKTLAGFIKAVGNHLIHLEKLDGKDFFDSLIRIENICAIDVRFREFQR